MNDSGQHIERVARGPKDRSVPGKPPGKGNVGGHGQAPFKPTDEQRGKIMVLVAAGFTREAIAVITSIPEATLERHFDFELREGKTICDGRILGGIVEAALAGDKTMSIFYAKARTGWRDTGSGADAASAAAVFSIQIGGGGSTESASEIKVMAIPRTIDHDPDDPDSVP